MYKIRAVGLRWLKGISSGRSFLLGWRQRCPVGSNRSIHYVDRGVVVIPGVFGCLLTGQSTWRQ